MTDRFEQKIAAATARHGLLEPGQPVGVALSGGADSVALLAALTALGYDCVALHCNFHLRGAESDRDCMAARGVASELGARWHMADMDVAVRTAATGESVEMACRSLRYDWFDTMRARLGLQSVAIAHNADDRMETFMLNALRSTGLRGLAAMRWRRGLYVRPMLGCSRSEVEAYLRRRGISWVTDSSNLTDDYRRNRVRHHVMPALEQVEPDARQRLSATIEYVDDARTLYEHMLGRLASRYTSADGSIDVAGVISGEGSAARLVLRELLAPRGLNMSQVDDIMASARESGRMFGSWLLDRGRLVEVAPAPDADEMEWTPGQPPVNIERIGRDEFRPVRDASVAYLDSSAFATPARWVIRPWRDGDRFRPFGMKGTRLVSDLLSDMHLSLEQKKRVRLLTRDGVIIWVMGLRASAHFAVTDTTGCIVRLTLEA